MDVQAELQERDTLIDQLTERLQQSIFDREELQKQGEVLTHEVEALKRQLADTLELIKKPPQFKDNVSCLLFFAKQTNILSFHFLDLSYRLVNVYPKCPSIS